MYGLMFGLLKLSVQFWNLLPQLGVSQLLENVVGEDTDECDK